MFGVNELSWTPFPSSMLFNAPKTTYAAEVSDIPAASGQQTNNVKWYSSTGTYWTDWGGTGGYTSTCGQTCDTVAKYLEVVKSRRNAGEGFTFITLGPQDTRNAGITPCADPNRETKADGSCDADCKDGYEPDTTSNSGSDCIEVAIDPNDCATANREKNDDDTCGDCLSGYSEDTAGDCVADEEDGPNYLLWGGIAVVCVIGYFVMK